MMNTTINNATVDTNNNKEGNIMTNINNTTITATAVEAKEDNTMMTEVLERLNVTKTTDEGYMTKIDIANALDEVFGIVYSLTQLKKIRRDSLVDEFIDKAYDAMNQSYYDDPEIECDGWNEELGMYDYEIDPSILSGNSNETVTEYITDEATDMPIDVVDIADEETVEPINEKEDKMNSKEKGFWTALANHMKKQESKGFGKSVSGFMLAALIGESFYGIQNLKKAINDGSVDDWTKKMIAGGMRNLWDKGYITPVIIEKKMKAMDGTIMSIHYGIENSYGIKSSNAVLVNYLSSFGELNTKDVVMFGINTDAIHDMMVERW